MDGLHLCHYPVSGNDESDLVCFCACAGFHNLQSSLSRDSLPSESYAKIPDEKEATVIEQPVEAQADSAQVMEAAAIETSSPFIEQTSIPEATLASPGEQPSALEPSAATEQAVAQSEEPSDAKMMTEATVVETQVVEEASQLEQAPIAGESLPAESTPEIELRAEASALTQTLEISTPEAAEPTLEESNSQEQAEGADLAQLDAQSLMAKSSESLEQGSQTPITQAYRTSLLIAEVTLAVIAIALGLTAFRQKKNR